MARRFPKIEKGLPSPARPVSFICVRFSGEFEHNIWQSECVHDERNEFIVVDNRANAHFATLGQAICAGIDKAHHELLVIVHEDVLLQPGWQAMFEVSLNTLENHDPDWSAVGIVGWDENDRLIGHSSDPHGYRNSFKKIPYLETSRIDEQLIVLQKSSGIRPDPNLPSIHNIGRDLKLQGMNCNRKCYVINAPAIHKWQDHNGKIIKSAKDSDKIKKRNDLTARHNRDVSDEYLRMKWGKASSAEDEPNTSSGQSSSLGPDELRVLDRPVILLGRGGSGTRLLSILARDAGLWIGNDLNLSGDAMEMVGAIYRAVYRKFVCPDPSQAQLLVEDLRASATEMFDQAGWPEIWGFKLPESIYVLPELQEAFPAARFVILDRDPLSTVLRRPHMTARIDNEIGRSVLPAAYAFTGASPGDIIDDEAALMMARTTAYQTSLLENSIDRKKVEQVLSLRFEDVITHPEESLAELCRFLNNEPVSQLIVDAVNPKRAQKVAMEFHPELISRVEKIVAPARAALGYI